MFKHDYKKQIEAIKPDGYVKEKVRIKLAKAQQKPKKPAKIYIGRSVAATLCLVTVLTLGVVFRKQNIPVKTVTETADAMKSAGDYNKIYSVLSNFKSEYGHSFIYSDGNIIEKATTGAVAETNIETFDGSAVTLNGASQNTNHSETTVQVEGVEESDIVKTDGKYIYILSHKYKNYLNRDMSIKIVEAGQKPKQLSDIVISNSLYPNEMYLSENRLIVLCDGNNSKVTALIYDISNPENPKKLKSCKQSGYLNSSRLIGDKLYIISELYVNVENMQEDNIKSYIPHIKCYGFNGAVSSDTVHSYNNCQSPVYTVISAFNIKDSTLVSTRSVLGGTYTMYQSTENIITAGYASYNKTQIARFEIDNGKIEFKASAKLSGTLLNQFSIDEYEGHFRFVLTEDRFIKNETVNSLVILNNDLEKTGKIANIAPDERVYSVRFMGDIAYFVTFREVDPLFSADLSNPNEPKIIGALKIPGFSNYLFPYGEGKLLGIGQNADEDTGETGNMKLSMFDISDPANVTENSKIDISAVYSEALYNHKAVLADSDKNIIAFEAQTVNGEENFYVYAYENGKFVKKLEQEITERIYSCRGVYIGEIFYIVSQYRVESYDIESFQMLGTLKLK